MHILFADDELDTRELYRFALLLAHHTMRLAADGDEAVQAVREEAFDAIVLDLRMPNTGGLEALSKIRTLPNGQHVPIVLLSAYASLDNLLIEPRTGADLLLHKPILPEDLVRQILQLVATFSCEAAQSTNPQPDAS
ncbi:MAG: two-component system, OmpR family, alkaline phosphatase synthesis response regulator PhoP [Abditibacteriota bacterium]|nr:two-component system, OmpR family, alkaline phosphatase synthesis response regulator PhoP [Abditibacteriota bacterium]